MVGFAGVDEQDDRVSVHSLASTVETHNTTTSLASRIRDLNLSFEDKLREADGERSVQSPLAEDSEEEQRAAGSQDGGPGLGRGRQLSEEELSGSLQLLPRDPPLQVCCRLFERRSHPPLPLKRMSMAQVEDFRQHGYVLIDNVISRDAAARVKAEALRISQRGLLQPVAASSMGVFTSSAPPGMQQLVGLPAPPAAVQPGSSPCGSARGSSHGQLAACGNGIHQQLGVQQQQQQQQQLHQQQQQLLPLRLQQASATQLQLQQPPQQQQRFGELRMPLVLGQPPADTAVFAPVMAALQDLQDDLAEFVRLRSKGGADYCLCALPAGSTPVPRHKDALPDDGRGASSSGSAGGWGAQAAGGALQAQQQVQAQQQPQPPGRRVSLFVFLNPDWDKEAGGGLRLWPPQRPVGPPSATAASAAARRSPTSSDAGTTFSEVSDSGSLRVPVLGSTTSSVIAEASAPDHDTYSLDGLSLAESEAERQGLEWLECEGGEMALDIAPLAGRVLLVLSGAVEHALLPAPGGGGSGGGGEMVFVRAWCS